MTDSDLVDFFKGSIKSYFYIAELNEVVSDLAAYYRQTKTGLTLGDSIVLATAHAYDAKLLTLDKRLQKHYEKLRGVK